MIDQTTTEATETRDLAPGPLDLGSGGQEAVSTGTGRQPEAGASSGGAGTSAPQSPDPSAQGGETDRGASPAPEKNSAGNLQRGVGRDGRRRAFGQWALARALKSQGLDAIEGSPLGADVARWRSEVASDLGGNLSAAEQAILAVASVKYALVAHLSNCFLENVTLAVRRKQAAPTQLLGAYQSLTNSLRDDLKTLGLKRVAREAETVESWLHRPVEVK